MRLGRSLARLIHAATVISHVVRWVSATSADRRIAGVPGLCWASRDQGDNVAVPRTQIPGFLQRVRALLYRHEARRTVLHAVIAAAMLALVLPLIGRLVDGHRTTATAVLGIAGLIAGAVAIGAVVIGVVAPRRRWGTDSDLARWVGTRR
ncbi:MAG: hypothetical protein AB7L28_22105, partial [Kofleriaceae bacterium]